MPSCASWVWRMSSATCWMAAPGDQAPGVDRNATTDGVPSSASGAGTTSFSRTRSPTCAMRDRCTAAAAGHRAVDHGNGLHGRRCRLWRRGDSASLGLSDNVNGIHLRWFDHWLKGGGQRRGARATVKLFLKGGNRWLDLPVGRPQMPVINRLLPWQRAGLAWPASGPPAQSLRLRSR